MKWGKQMKRKILKIVIICMLMISSIAIIAGGTNNKTNQPTATLYSDDVPTWQIGDSWTYTVNDFTFDYEVGGQKIYFDGSIDDFTWTVADTSGSTYTIDFTGKLNCDYEIYLSSSSLTLYVIGTIKESFTRMTGSIIFTKENLDKFFKAEFLCHICA